MTLRQAIVYAIDREGIGIITETRFLNYLSDLQAFAIPASKRIVSAMITNKYFDKLLSSLNDENYELQFNEVKTNLVRYEGFRENLVNHVLNSVLYAVRNTGNAPQMPSVPVEKKASPNPRPVGNIVKPSLLKVQKVYPTINNDYIFGKQSYDYSLTKYSRYIHEQHESLIKSMIWEAIYQPLRTLVDFESEQEIDRYLTCKKKEIMDNIENSPIKDEIVSALFKRTQLPRTTSPLNIEQLVDIYLADEKKMFMDSMNFIKKLKSERESDSYLARLKNKLWEIL